MILALASREPMKRRPGVGTQANQAGVPDEPAARVSAPRARRLWLAQSVAPTLAANAWDRDAADRSEDQPCRSPSRRLPDAAEPDAFREHCVLIVVPLACQAELDTRPDRSRVRCRRVDVELVDSRPQQVRESVRLDFQV